MPVQAYVKMDYLTVRARLGIMHTMKKRKNPHAVALARMGAKKGGHARAAKLSSEERSESARRAAQARWKTKRKRSKS